MISEDWIILSVAVAGFFYVSGIVLAVDAEFGARVEAMFEEDFANSRLVEQAELDAHSVWFKFCVRVARLAAPIQ